MLFGKLSKQIRIDQDFRIDKLEKCYLACFLGLWVRLDTCYWLRRGIIVCYVFVCDTPEKHMFFFFKGNEASDLFGLIHLEQMAFVSPTWFAWWIGYMPTAVALVH